MARVITKLPTWFNIENYSDQSLSSMQLKSELTRRHIVVNHIRQKLNVDESQSLKEYYSSVREKQTPLELSTTKVDPEVEKLIHELADYLRSIQADISPLWPNLHLRGVSLLTKNDAQRFSDAYEAIPKGAEWERHDGTIPYDLILEDISKPTLTLTLDLQQPDNVLLENIGLLLPVIRQYRKWTPNAPKTRKGDIDKIKDYRIIPFIDLEIWAMEQAASISNQSVLIALELDKKPFWTSEDIRKTARPYLNKCLDPAFINALETYPEEFY